MAFYGSQFAYDNAEEEWNETHPQVREKAREEFDEEWLESVELSDKVTAVLLMFAQSKKVNDIELQAFKKELTGAYELALETYTDKNILRIEREMIEASYD